MRIAIVGAGFAGIGLTIRLKQEGIHDVAILERASDLGGTWRDNSYPGCACDVPSLLYSYSFAPNPNWSLSFSPQAEIWDYLRDTAERYGVVPHIRYGHEVLAADWDEGAARWRIATPHGEITAEILVTAQGGLSEPSIPPDSGPGQVSGGDVPLRHVGPRSRPRRRAHCGDRHGRIGDPVRPAHPAQGRQADAVPAHAAVGDATKLAPALRRRALAVQGGPRRRTGRARGHLLGPRDLRADVQAPAPGAPGRARGPRAHAPPDLRSRAAAKAHAGTTVAGFPNLFMLTGPNTGLGHNSIIFMIESQISYLLGALRAMRARDVDTLEIKPEAQAAFCAEMDAGSEGTVWTAGGCKSWYLDATGRNSILWPRGTWAFRERLRRFDAGSYRASRSSGRRSPDAAESAAVA